MSQRDPADPSPRRVLVVEWRQTDNDTAREAGRKRPVRSRELAPLHLGEAIGVRMAERTSRSAAEAVSAYKRHRKKAALRGRDGALAEIPMSFARAGAAAAEEMARAPSDVVRTVDRRQARRASERVVRAVRRALRR